MLSNETASIEPSSGANNLILSSSIDHLVLTSLSGKPGFSGNDPPAFSNNRIASFSSISKRLSLSGASSSQNLATASTNRRVCRIGNVLDVH